MKEKLRLDRLLRLESLAPSNCTFAKELTWRSTDQDVNRPGCQPTRMSTDHKQYVYNKDHFFFFKCLWKYCLYWNGTQRSPKTSLHLYEQIKVLLVFKKKTLIKKLFSKMTYIFLTLYVQTCVRSCNGIPANRDYDILLIMFCFI